MGTRQLGLISITSQIKYLTLQMLIVPSIMNVMLNKYGQRVIYLKLWVFFFFQILKYLTPIPFHGS